MSTIQKITLHNVTETGGVDYLQYRLLVVKEEQRKPGFSLPQKPRPSASKRAECTPPAVSPLDASASTSTAATTPADEARAPEWTPPSKEQEVEVFEGDGELPDEQTIWTSAA